MLFIKIENIKFHYEYLDIESDTISEIESDIECDMDSMLKLI